MMEWVLVGDIDGCCLILLYAYLFANYDGKGLVFACLVNLGLGF